MATSSTRGTTFEEGIEHAQEQIEGSCSILILTDEGIYAARDRLGRTPLVIGEKEGARAVTFETCALPNLGYEVTRYLGPGEIVRLTQDGVEQVKAPGTRCRSAPSSGSTTGIRPPATRGSTSSRFAIAAAGPWRSGTMWRSTWWPGSRIPGPGTPSATPTQAEIPYRRPFVKYTPTWPRSFMPQDQRVRDLVARMKLIPIQELIEGNRLLFCEDSIVRGTQLQDIIQRVFDYGAQEVHMRPACPPLIYGCKFLNFSRSRSELDLAGRRAIQELERGEPEDLAKYADPDAEPLLRHGGGDPEPAWA